MIDQNSAFSAGFGLAIRELMVKEAGMITGAVRSGVKHLPGMAEAAAKSLGAERQGIFKALQANRNFKARGGLPAIRQAVPETAIPGGWSNQGFAEANAVAPEIKAQLAQEGLVGMHQAPAAEGWSNQGFADAERARAEFQARGGLPPVKPEAEDVWRNQGFAGSSVPAGPGSEITELENGKLAIPNHWNPKGPLSEAEKLEGSRSGGPYADEHYNPSRDYTDEHMRAGTTGQGWRARAKGWWNNPETGLGNLGRVASPYVKDNWLGRLAGYGKGNQTIGRRLAGGLAGAGFAANAVPTYINNQKYQWQNEHPIASWLNRTFMGAPQYHDRSYFLPSFMQD